MGWKFTTGDRVQHSVLPGVWRVVSPGFKPGTYVVRGDPSSPIASALTSIARRGIVVVSTAELTAITVHQETLQ